MSQESPPSASALLHLSWPATVIYGAFALRLAFDVWMVGSLGEELLAAIAGGMYTYHLPLAFGSGLLVAVNTLVAQYHGRREHLECGRYFFQGVLLGLAMGAIALLVVPLCPWFFSLLGHDAVVQRNETAYLQLILFALGPQFIAVAANHFFFAIGRPRQPMVVSLVALLLNIALSATLIFGLFGLPQLGIRGAALASVIVSIAQAVALVLMVYLSARSHARLPLRLWYFLPSRQRLRNLVRVGVPNGVHECVEVAIWSVAIVFLIGQFGSAHLAAAALVLTLVDALYAPIEGFGGAMTALVGRDVGAGRHDHARMWTRIGLRVTIPFVAIVSLACLLIQGPLLNAISASSEVRIIASQIFSIFPLMMVSFALIAVYDYALVGAGDTLWPAISHLSANLVFLIGGGTVMIRFFPATGSFGVWSAATIALVFVAGLFFLRWRSGYWRDIDLIGETA